MPSTRKESRVSNSLYDKAIHSPVHQIILAAGEIDVIPEQNINGIKSVLKGPHTLWTDDAIVQLLIENFPPEVLQAYGCIKPLALKADLARYCILYVYGGWYVDLFVRIENLDVLKRFNENTEAILFRELPINGGAIFSTLNTIFWFSSPNHEILKNAIIETADNINSKNYGNHPFSVTGALVLGEAVAKYQLGTKSLNFAVGECQMINSRPSHVFNFVQDSSPTVFSSRRPIEEDISSQVPAGYERHPNNYWKKWFERDIFY